MLKSYYAMTHKGPYFNSNQDAYYLNQDYHLFGIVDGFGGTGIGDIVSSNLTGYIHEVFTKATHDQDATLKYFYDSRRSIECNFLVNGIMAYNETLMAENETKNLYQRGGANCLFVIDHGGRVSVVSIGKIYGLLLRNGKMRSFSNVDDGIGLEITNFVATADTWTKSALGLFSPLQLQINEFTTQPGDQIILATIGAVNLVENDFVLQCFNEQQDKVALAELFKHANIAGNRDNQTAILLRY